MTEGTRTEATRIADQLRRAFDGEAWHGDSLFEILEGVRATQAGARLIQNVHSIWELVLHIAAWDGAVLRRLGGAAVELSGAENFPQVTDGSEEAWRKTRVEVRRVHEDLIKTVAELPDSRLEEIVPGKKEVHYTFYYMLHGVVQHELYHAGQIALLKKATIGA
ncbi:MAG: DinB family protein [Terriglobales bacterium]